MAELPGVGEEHRLGRRLGANVDSNDAGIFPKRVPLMGSLENLNPHVGGVNVVHDVHMSIFKDVMHALADGFGYVIASLVGALVALTFTVPGEFPDTYYIGTIVLALVGAVVITLLRRAIDRTIRVPDPGEEARARQVDVAIKRIEVMDQEIKSMRDDVKELRKPWWRRRAG